MKNVEKSIHQSLNDNLLFIAKNNFYMDHMKSFVYDKDDMYKVIVLRYTRIRWRRCILINRIM